MNEESIFVVALEKLPAERAAYLDKACGSDGALRKRLDGLLAASDNAGQFMARPAVAAGASANSATEILDGESTPNEAAVTRDGPVPVDEDHAEALSFLAPSTRPDSLGRIGHYEVLQVLGKGGFGIVFRAFDDVLQRVVAVKVMAPQLAATSPARKRFLREARTSAAVRHENVVQVYEVAEQPLPYLAMEFIPGETLQQRLDRTGPLDVAETLRIGRQIAEGLAAAHATDLIHRDIKPSNVLIESGQNRVKITDFGLARAADDASISQSGIIAGTPMYMAPEQALGHKLDQRADLFSLGSVLYQMVAGRPPFRANNTVAVLKRVAEDTPRAIREIIPETPQWLCDIIAKLHAKNPDDRYQSAREVADVLADCEAQLKTNSKLKDFSRIPRGTPTPRNSGWWKWAAALVPILAGIVVIVLNWHHLFGGHQAAQEPIKPDGGPTPAVADGWVQLFNGKDLTGWKTHPDAPGEWKVADGILVNDKKPGYLFSERGDYENFHLRVDAKINSDGDSGIFFRSQIHPLFEQKNAKGKSPPGYEAQIGTLLPARTGSLYLTEKPGHHPGLFREERLLTPAGEWFTLEVIANGPWIIVNVNGERTAYVKNDGPTRGHIALQAYDDKTFVQFKKIEIKELPASSPQVPRTAAEVLPFMTGTWKCESVEAAPNVPDNLQRSTGISTFEPVADNKFLRVHTTLGPRNIELLAIHSYDAAKDTIFSWCFNSEGLTCGPGAGVFDRDKRSLLLMQKLNNGNQDIHLFEFVDANTIKTRLFNQNPKNEIVLDVRNTFTRLDKQVADQRLPKDPKRPNEMNVLDRLVGEWRNEITVSVAGPDTKVETVRVKAESILGGRFIEKFETNEATGASDYTLGWFDTDAKKYRTWFFNHAGSVTEFTGIWDDAAKTLTWNSADGRLEGRWTFKGDDLREFRHIIKATDGKILNEAAGVSRRIAPTAKQEPLPPTFKNSIGMEFVIVPKGKSWLGGGKDKLGDQEVEMPADFYLGKYEVTQEEWEKVTGLNPSSFKAVEGIKPEDQKRFPVEQMTWDDCQEFVKLLNAKVKEPGWVYRLPTEREWEYACRGGPLSDRFKSAFDFYLDKPTNTLTPDQAIFKETGLQRTCKVGSYKPNALGLYDMHGNVWEWCQDEIPGDPNDPKADSLRVFRGGSWGDDSRDCGAASRAPYAPSFRFHHLGLRLARVQSGAPSPKVKTPAAAADFREIHGVNRQAFDVWLAQIKTDGYVPQTLAAWNSSTGDPQYASIAILSPNVESWQVVHSSGKAEDRKPKIEELRDQGYRPLATAVTVVKQTAGQVELWIKERDRRRTFYLFSGPGNLLETRLKEFHDKGVTMPISFSTAPLAIGGTMFSQVYGPADGLGWHVELQLTKARLLEVLEEQRLKDRYPTCLAVHTVEGQLRYLALFVENRDRLAWSVSFDLTAGEYEQELAKQKQQGFRPRHVFARDDKGVTRYGVIWQANAVAPKRSPPPAVAPFTDADVKRIAALPAAEQVEEVRKELQRLNPKFVGKLEHKIEGDAVTELHILTDEVVNIAPVRALKGLIYLDCRGTYPNKGKLSDLSPLKGMTFSRLDCSSTQVADLTPLAGVPLTFLHFNHNPVSTLAPLKGMPLVNLGCAETKVSDLSPLKGMKLQMLGAQLLAVTDLSPLQGMPLKGLDLYHTIGATNLEPLKGMPLEGLNLQDVPVSDLSALKGMTSLRTLHLAGNALSDLRPLQGLKLSDLIIREKKVSDLSPLKGMPLARLEIYGTGVTDLRPLQGMELTEIRVPPQNITLGLDILRAMKSLKTIGISGDQAWPAAEFWERYDKEEFK